MCTESLRSLAIIWDANLSKQSKERNRNSRRNFIYLLGFQTNYEEISRNHHKYVEAWYKSHDALPNEDLSRIFKCHNRKQTAALKGTQENRARDATRCFAPVNVSSCIQLQRLKHELHSWSFFTPTHADIIYVCMYVYI